MSNSNHTGNPDAPAGKVPVWDWPTRLFHWLLVAAVVTCLVTAQIGGNWMTTHMLSGYLVLTLLIFRLVWGVVGGYHARFVTFVRGPLAVWRYATGIFRSDSPRHLGHNPLGAWSVVAMLAALLLQASTGLFASDDIFTEGPLYPMVSNALSQILTRIHRANAVVIGTLVTVHVAAILFYLVVKRDNLIKPMFNGVKVWHSEAPPRGGSLWAAAVIAAASGAAVYWIVT